MMVGLPASGKSTLSEKYSKELNYYWLSSDKIRSELRDTFNNKELNYRTFKKMNELTLIYLKSGNSVIYDATNLNHKDRRNILKAIIPIKDEYNIYLKAIFLDTPYEECVRRNNSREARVPNKFMEMYKNKLQVPDLSEGFDSIEIIKED